MIRKVRKPIDQSILASLPCSDDAEKGILSCFLHTPALIPDFSKDLPKEAFYLPHLRLLYETMLLFLEKGNPLDYITLSQYFNDKGLMDRIGGQGLLAEVLDFVPTTTHYGYYKGIVRDKYLLRRIVTTCNESIADAYSYQEDVPKLLALVDQKISSLSKEASGMVEVKTFKDDVSDFEKHWYERYQRREASAIPSRWIEWNKHFGGLRPEFHIFKGRTSKGKTTLALNMLCTVAVEHQKPCLWFPYEMSKRSLICRLLSDLAQVDSRCLFSPDVFPPTKEEMNRIAIAKETLYEAPIELVKQRNMDASFIVNRSMAFAQKHGEVGLIGVDYLQRIPHPEWSGRNDNTSDRLTYNCGQCFSVQQELGCAMILISSTNQEGGTLGSQSADYDTDIAVEVDKDHGIRIPKNRNGPTVKDWMTLKFNSNFVRFESNPLALP